VRIKTRPIDEVDSIILRTLLAESRTSFTELAKKCGISVTAIIRRYARLKKTGIIAGEHMYLNPLSLGYESIAEIGILTGLENQQKVAESLIANSSIKVITAGFAALGKYDAYCLLMAKKLNELTELVRRIDIKPYVKNLDVLIFADLWNNPWHPENIVVKPSKQEDPISNVNRLRKKFEPVILDDTDKIIIKALMENSRVAFNDIAEKLKISTANVIQRYHVLREKNVLNLSSISVDLCKLGYKAITDSYIKVENSGTLPEIQAQLLQIPNLAFCAEFVGGVYDIRVAVIASDFQDVFHLKQRIFSIKNIKSAEFYLHEVPVPWPNDFMGQNLAI
jgi:Lrp/AsnC family transcriptional regulator for asnA, asnC and gidA